MYIINQGNIQFYPGSFHIVIIFEKFLAVLFQEANFAFKYVGWGCIVEMPMHLANDFKQSRMLLIFLDTI